uniref:Uncharacterized protein n=1 Tax=Xenopus tropicalis TaxID=8364 RepID=A0A803JFA3_XENTR
IYLSVSFCLSIYLSICLSIFLSLSVCLSIIHPSIHLHIYPPTYLSSYLSLPQEHYLLECKLSALKLDGGRKLVCSCFRMVCASDSIERKP